MDRSDPQPEDTNTPNRIAMPRESLSELKSAIESAPEMTPEHRAEMLKLVASLEEEVSTPQGPAEGESAEKLRGAIAATQEVVRQRGGSEELPEDHDLGERLGELEEKIEMVALEHPVIANVLTAIARLV